MVALAKCKMTWIIDVCWYLLVMCVKETRWNQYAVEPYRCSWLQRWSHCATGAPHWCCKNTSEQEALHAFTSDVLPLSKSKYWFHLVSVYRFIIGIINLLSSGSYCYPSFAASLQPWWTDMMGWHCHSSHVEWLSFDTEHHKTRVITIWKMSLVDYG